MGHEVPVCNWLLLLSVYGLSWLPRFAVSIIIMF